ncbi:MAG: exosortase/archaeosortase family protein [candidate division Zixibacteria bacterium]|nr:exosortase/archaeosortase family protein [candidate division Zixibacteria bacterium]
MNSSHTAIVDHIKTHLYPYIILATAVLCSIPILKDLIGDWIRDDNYSHGFFIIPIAVYIFYRRRNDLSLPARPSAWGMVLFVLGCVGVIFGIAAGEFFTTRFSLVIVISGLALYYLGTANFRKVWFAFFFLLFMIPIPAVIYYSATLPMQLFGSGITNDFLQFLGVPSFRQGNIIFLPEYTLEVSEACSGLRSLVTLLALGALYGYAFLPGKVAPVILFICTVPIAIATNIFRLVFTALGAYAVSTELAEDFLHEISGLLVFVSALVLMVILGAILKWARRLLS